MNKQRKVLITITYNEMGIIIDTKAEEVAQPEVEKDTNVPTNDCISRQAAVRWVKTECNPYGNPTLDFESGKKVIEHLEQMPSAQPESLACGEGELNVPDTNVGDTISRRAAIDALWKALFEYEDKTEKQFQESEDLDVGDWIVHRCFVQNMSDIDRQTILNLPSAQPERKKGEWIVEGEFIDCSVCRREKWSRIPYGDLVRRFRYCPNCGADMRGETDE